MEQREVMEFDDIEVLKILSSPMRIRILRHLLEPATVKDVAEILDVPVTRLYYHVNLLDEAGIISVVETRKSGAMVQKVYQASARNFRPASGLAAGDHSPEELARIATGVVLDGARVDAETALTRHFAGVAAGNEGGEGTFGRSIALFSREQAERFTEKLTQFIEEEFDDVRTEGKEYSLTYVFFPLAGAPVEDTRG